MSEIGLGSIAYGGAQYYITDNPVSKENTKRTIKRALEFDINYLDCTDIYGAYGNAEKIIGETTMGMDREYLQSHKINQL